MAEGQKNNTSLMTAVTQHTGRYGSHHWFRLGLDLEQRHAPVEPMHTIKIFAEHMIKLINGDEDGPKVRAAERANGRFKESCTDQIFTAYAKEKRPLNQKKSSDPNCTVVPKKLPKGHLPDAPFTLTAQQKEVADKRLACVKVPVGFGDLPNSMFKSHTWMQLFTTGILRLCLKELLGDQQRSSLFNFLCLLEQLFSNPIDMHSIDSLEVKWHQGLAMLERDFPNSLLVQWLLSMLETAGVMSSNAEIKKENGLHSGRFKVVKRPTTDLEKTALYVTMKKTIYQVEVFHYAIVNNVKFRDMTIEKPSQRESMALVINNDRIGKIVNFVKADGQGIAIIEDLGMPNLCDKSTCYFVRKEVLNIIGVPISCLKPTVYMEEGDCIWLPKV